jgi:hypothetical protein
MLDPFGTRIFLLHSCALDNANGASKNFDLRTFGEIMAALAKNHEGLLYVFLDVLKEQRGVNSFKLLLIEIDNGTGDAMQKQLTPVATLLLSHLGLSQGGYQPLINATAWTAGEQESRACRVRCPLGTPLCRWSPLNHFLTETKSTAAKLGLENMDKGATILDCKLILIDQLQSSLFKAGLFSFEEGMTIWVQTLGDAKYIWRSLQINGATIVLKVI